MAVPTFLYVALGGAIGATLRFFIASAVMQRVQLCADHWCRNFPLGTLAVNLIGSFALGLLAAYIERRHEGQHEIIAAFFAVGLLGGLTTYSTFMLEIWQLWRQHNVFFALFYCGCSLILGLLAVAWGYKTNLA